METSQPCKIGERLVEKKLITNEQLAEALAAQQGSGLRCGEVILSKGWITATEFYGVLTDQFRRGRIGDLLVEEGLLTLEQLEEAIAIQKDWGTRLGDIVLAKGWVKSYSFYQVLADHFDKPFVNLMDEPSDESLVDVGYYHVYLETLFVPWRKVDGLTLVAVADMDPVVMAEAERVVDGPVDFVVTSKFDIVWSLQKYGDAFFSEKSVHELRKRQPQYSASTVFTKPQLIFAFILMSLTILAVAIWPIPTLIAINVFISVFLLFNFGLRLLFTWVGGDKRFDNFITDKEVEEVKDIDLPTYTILVPMYKESESLPHLAESLRNLDYPLSKLDIKIILEEDDEETIQTAKDLGLEGIFEIIKVPDSLPKTKPKACNYALNFARGELITIYDGEDAPEADQLKKVVLAFRKSSKNTAVIQARLNYFNVTENWLTRMFTMEYSLWFDFYLPALDALKIPIPLGGTSNHFKMEVLRELQGWDPYNVTEDADLGVRLTQRNYRVGVVNSTTYEEANKDVHNWIRQRSRWLKGYMQTYLVHMRRPLKFYGTLGHVGFWGFQFFIGGTILSVLLSPLLMLLFITWLLTQTAMFDPIFPAALLYINLINLLMGNGFLITLFMLSGFKRHYYKLMPWSMTVPIYWLLMSWAGYKGLWQLVFNPFYWEKTHHGLTSYATSSDVSDLSLNTKKAG
ncbi:beta-monoglucosyldiacylglycerol synthase [Mariprofundus micogutta]|uniref:Beta-monoglucosyldiacylglycerol synthase n=1 Tax=Mariprofundus micogutta TaxID=1921010 RepID=A0A1L8CKW7_9PROT|nr:glycosyltransferase family 2 protein [Mariprofundus micogutta]GAV19556.1 beta-monoglucosyldiacylglycerol synthase [Mariprofundus micogutta]